MKSPPIGDMIMKELFYNDMTESYKGLDNTNPLMTQRFGADPYALVYDDRVYIYMTADIFEHNTDGEVVDNTYGRINQINVISTDDMVNFTDHGSIKAASNQGAAKWARNSWAPAAAWKEIDGKPRFFLYFADAGGGIGVLQSDSPTGPFEDPLGKALISRQTPECADVLWLFDPAVLLDDDGRAYLYFGGGVPEGQEADPGTARVVELGEDMISIVGQPQRINPPYLFEDSGIHKAGDKYYYTYCSNFQVDQAGMEKYGFENGEIICMESDSPMGPFTFKERILKNPGSTFGLGGVNTVPADSVSQSCGSGNMALGDIQSGDFIKVQGVDFGSESPVSVRMTVRNKKGEQAFGAVQIRVDGPEGSILGYLPIKEIPEGAPEGEPIEAPIGSPIGGEFTECTVQLSSKAEGVHDLYFIFAGEKYEIETWQFVK